MELIASIEALKYIKTKSKINLFTDSKYIIDGIKVWIKLEIEQLENKN